MKRVSLTKKPITWPYLLTIITKLKMSLEVPKLGQNFPYIDLQKNRCRRDPISTNMLRYIIHILFLQGHSN